MNVPLQMKYGGVGLIIIGTAMALMAGLAFLQASDAKYWPAVDARVVRSGVEVTKKVDGVRRGTAVSSDYYSAAIRYEYVVNGQTYTGSRITLDESDSSGFDRR